MIGIGYLHWMGWSIDNKHYRRLVCTEVYISGNESKRRHFHIQILSRNDTRCFSSTILDCVSRK
jgi:hypothetical protein